MAGGKDSVLDGTNCFRWLRDRWAPERSDIARKAFLLLFRFGLRAFCWEVLGNLNLYGTSQLAMVVVSLGGGLYRGSTSFKQSAFGITPIRRCWWNC